jgi:hypothetical protein
MQLRETFSECSYAARKVIWRRGAKEPDHRHSLLLRAHRERPCGRDSAN